MPESFGENEHGRPFTASFNSAVQVYEVGDFTEVFGVLVDFVHRAGSLARVPAVGLVHSDHALHELAALGYLFIELLLLPYDVILKRLVQFVLVWHAPKE